MLQSQGGSQSAFVSVACLAAFETEHEPIKPRSPKPPGLVDSDAARARAGGGRPRRRAHGVALRWERAAVGQPVGHRDGGVPARVRLRERPGHQPRRDARAGRVLRRVRFLPAGLSAVLHISPSTMAATCLKIAKIFGFFDECVHSQPAPPASVRRNDPAGRPLFGTCSRGRCWSSLGWR